MSIIDRENIKLQVIATDWEDSVRQSGELLIKTGYILQGYIEDTVQSVKELGPYIVLTPGFALAHTRPSEAVLKNGVSLLTLKEPICFDSENDPVTIVMTLAATDNESHLDKIQAIAEILSVSENIEKISGITDVDEIMEMFSN